MKSFTICVAALALAGTAFAKLPAPSDEAKAKSAEAAAKAAHGGKVEAYLLCKSQDRVAARTNKTAKPVGKDAKGTAAAPASTCTDPGPFVYVPAGAASAPAPAQVTATAPKK